MSEEEAASPSATTDDKAPSEEDDVIGGKEDDCGVGAASTMSMDRNSTDQQSGELGDTQRETFARDQTGILGPNKRGSSTAGGSGERKSRGSSLSSALKRLSFGGSSSSSKRLSITRRRSKTNNNATATKKIHFENITIREYEVQPSDNPSAMTGGVGVELGWKFNVLTNNYSIDHFEQQREHQRLKNYHMRPLPPMDRVKLLKEEFGYTDKEIEEARKCAEQLQKERERSIKRLKLDWLDLLMENLSCCRSSSSSVVVIDGSGGGGEE
jgi:hypothetical protein